MICSSCGGKIPDDSATCPECGANTAHVDLATPPNVMRDVEAALAAANLCRMRGMWQEAEAKGIDVLRLDPNNVHAHSLIGDLYRDQGRLDEAAQWYRMALDLSPESRADRAKLQQVEADIARRPPQDVGTRLMPTGATVGTQKLMGASPVFWVRVLAVTSIVFLVGVVLLLAFGRSRGKNMPSVPVTNAPVVSSPDLHAGPGAPLPAGSAPVTSGMGTRVYATSEATTSDEMNLYQAISSAVQGRGTSVAGVIMSHRDSRVTVILMRQADAGGDRGSAMVDGLAVAHVVGARATGWKHVSVSERVRQGGNPPVTVFEGDVDVAAAQAVQLNADYAQIRNVFSSIWTPGETQAPGAQNEPESDSGI